MVPSWQWGILAPLAVAVATDLRVHKIFNWLTMPTLLLGLLLALVTGGLHGLASSALGALIGFVPPFVLMVLTPAMKAGDVKLMAAAGAWLGRDLVVPGMVYGIVAWGVLAVLYMLVRGTYRQVFRNLARFLMTLPVGGLELANDAMVLTDASYLPLGTGIAMGCVVALWAPHFVPAFRWPLP